MSEAEEDLDAPEDDVEMGFFEHLAELRTRVIHAVLGLIPGVSLGWIYREPILEFLVQPLAKAWRSLGLGDQPALHLQSPVDGFMAYFKVALISGILITSPWLFWQIWRFISPGLYRREKRYAIPFVVASTVCFAGGALFGYRFVFPLMFETLLSFGGMLPEGSLRLQHTIRLDEYMSFATQLLLAFGVVFEVPVVIVCLAATGVVTWRQLLGFGRWYVLIASVVAALLTPPDVGSQLMMLVPLIVLYYVSVGLAYFVGRAPAAERAAEPETGA